MAAKIPGLHIPAIFGDNPEVTAVATYRHPDYPGHFDFRRIPGNPHWRTNMATLAGFIGVPLNRMSMPSGWTHGDKTDGPIVCPATNFGYAPRGQDPFNPIPACDSLYTILRNCAVTAMGADCPGALYYAPGRSNRPAVVGAIHGGWKPLASGVVGDTFRELELLGIRADELLVYVAPGAGIESFVLDDPARKRLQLSADNTRVSLLSRTYCTPQDDTGHFMFGLNQAFRDELLSHGVRDDDTRLEYNGDDTISTIDSDTGDFKYHSARRELEDRGAMAWGIRLT